MDSTIVWGLLFAGAFVLLGAAIFFADRLRRPSRAVRERANEAAREKWGKEDMR
jgi:hypothetical protein